MCVAFFYRRISLFSSFARSLSHHQIICIQNTLKRLVFRYITPYYILCAFMKKQKPSKQRPAQKQSPPGNQKKMKPLPLIEKPHSKGWDKLIGKVGIITGGPKAQKGELESGKSHKKVTNQKPAIAIGLSEARKKGAKVPRKTS